MAVMKIDGTTQLRFTGDLDLDSNKITNLATPTASGDAANKGYVDSATQALDAKGSVVAASTAAGTLADDFGDGDTLDGVTLSENDRILIKDQTDASENGVYIVGAGGSAQSPGYLDVEFFGITTGWMRIQEDAVHASDYNLVFAEEMTIDPITVVLSGTTITVTIDTTMHMMSEIISAINSDVTVGALFTASQLTGDGSEYILSSGNQGNITTNKGNANGVAGIREILGEMAGYTMRFTEVTANGTIYTVEQVSDGAGGATDFSPTVTISGTTITIHGDMGMPDWQQIKIAWEATSAVNDVVTISIIGGDGSGEYVSDQTFGTVTLGRVATIGGGGGGAPTRATDMDAAGEFAGGICFVEGGTVNADSGWVCTNNGSVTVDTTNITFEQFTGTGQLTAGAGMTKSANTINIVSGNAGIVANANDITLTADDSSLEVSGSGVQVKNAGVTEAHLNSSIAGDGLAGGAGTALSVSVDDSTIETDSDALRVKADGIKGSHLDQRKEVTSDALASDQWTLSATPFDDDHLLIWFNGQALSLTDDYTRSGATITFVTETGAGDNFLALYYV